MSSKKITKLNEFFYMTSEGEILKYKKYCIINNCKNYLLTTTIIKRNFIL